MSKSDKKKKDTLKVSKKTLKMMDKSMENLENGNVYGPINIK